MCLVACKSRYVTSDKGTASDHPTRRGNGGYFYGSPLLREWRQRVTSRHNWHCAFPGGRPLPVLLCVSVADNGLQKSRTPQGPLPAPTVMLSRLLKEHQAKQSERRDLQEKRRKEAITAATCLTEALVDHLNVGVAQAYVNQRKLDHEVKTLQIQAAQFAKQTGQWIGMVENFNQALKEIGDVENWARSIEMDMRTIATALEYVYKGQLQPTTS
ncbi:hypothetical protein NDU88_001083 [Pleurodeles waltl]|uniref:Biogenesis of lysosome-related organelles complex 1 subunit 1 n=2 Tax=Pleurodeles waltl TaxID=8319 RepID=A0AAV7S7L2_PLEWA|nr:hypothetical protein NDU88_001083 [Pleurodeles waltl]